MRFWMRLGLLILVAVLTFCGIKRLHLDTDILGTLPADLPEAAGLRILRDGFSGGDELLVGLVAPDSEAAAASVAGLGAHLRGVSHLVRSVEWAGTLENPDAAAALLAWALQNAPPDRIARLESQLGPDKLAAHLERVLEKLASSPDPAEVQRWSYDPLGLLEAVDLGGLTSMDDAGFSTASADGTVRLLLVAPKEKLTGYKRASAWMAEVQGEILKWQNAGGDARHRLQFLYTGEPSFMAETGSGIERDLSGTIGLATVLIAALFWFMFRRWKMLLWIQVLLALVVLFSLALGGWVLGELSIMSSGLLHPSGHRGGLRGLYFAGGHGSPASLCCGVAAQCVAAHLRRSLHHGHRVPGAALQRPAGSGGHGAHGGPGGDGGLCRHGAYHAGTGGSRKSAPDRAACAQAGSVSTCRVAGYGGGAARDGGHLYRAWFPGVPVQLGRAAPCTQPVHGGMGASAAGAGQAGPGHGAAHRHHAGLAECA
nr:hypothetical protein [Verrucomicrobium spinosum]